MVAGRTHQPDEPLLRRKDDLLLAKKDENRLCRLVCQLESII